MPSLMYVAIPAAGDIRVREKETEKVEKYKLKFGMLKLYFKSRKVQNCLKKTSKTKTHPPINVQLTFCVALAVWVWMLPFTSFLFEFAE